MAARKISRRFDESVSMAAVASVVVTPDDEPTQVEEEDTQQFTAVIKDAAGNTIPQASGAIAWTRNLSAAGTISSSGLFTAGTTPGDYTVTATHTASGVAGTVDVEVTAAA
jgi:hypothetical protein